MNDYLDQLNSAYIKAIEQSRKSYIKQRNLFIIIMILFILIIVTSYYFIVFLPQIELINRVNEIYQLLGLPNAK
jgi:uncharacterized BrkB/YihY/UPF0761 family membrane protein